LYFSPKYNQKDQSNEDEMGKECSTNGKNRTLCRTFVGKSEGNRPLGKSWCRWDDNIKMDLREARLGVLDWIHVAQNRDRRRPFVNTVLNILVP
jgi:hypothetical protein